MEQKEVIFTDEEDAAPIEKEDAVLTDKVVVCAFRSASCPLRGDELDVVAGVVVESGFIDLHCDVVFKIDEVRRAVLIRSKECFIVDLVTAGEAPATFDPTQGTPKLRPLIIQPSYKRASAQMYSGVRPPPVPVLDGVGTWKETTFQLADRDGQVLVEVDIYREKEPTPFSLVLDNSALRERAPGIQPDVGVRTCPNYEKKYGTKAQPLIQYACQLYLFMGVVPHVSYLFIDQLRDVEARGDRYGRFIDITIHVNSECKRCTQKSEGDPLFLGVSVDPVQMEASALVLRKGGAGFEVSEAD